jgi:hypothetical protein
VAFTSNAGSSSTEVSAAQYLGCMLESIEG